MNIAENEAVPTNLYRALYFFKNDRFSKCLELCNVDLNTLTHRELSKNLNPLVGVSIELPFRTLLDDDLFNLIGFLLIYDVKTFTFWNSYFRHPKSYITPRFMILYLKLRCLIELSESKLTITKTARLFVSKASSGNFDSFVKLLFLRFTTRNRHSLNVSIKKLLSWWRKTNFISRIFTFK